MDDAGKNKEHYCDEVDLMDYMRVILKWKWLIVGIVLLAVGIAGIVSQFVLPDVYSIETTLEIGGARGGLENPIQVAEKVNTGAYLAGLGIGFLSFDIEAESVKETNLVQISVETSDQERAKVVLNEINYFIISSHRQEFEKRTKEIEKEITGIQRELDFLKTSKVYTESIAPLYLKFSDLETLLSDAKMTRVVKEPAISEYPIRPNTGLNIVMAGALALFSSVFLAFALEWWKTYEKN